MVPRLVPVIFPRTPVWRWVTFIPIFGFLPTWLLLFWFAHVDVQVKAEACK